MDGPRSWLGLWVLDCRLLVGGMYVLYVFSIWQLVGARQGFGVCCSAWRAKGGDMKRVIIDTDPGIDDAAAIFFALNSPEIRVEALTVVFGNVALDQCAENALRILEAAGREDIPVYKGAGRPFGLGEPDFARYIHGSDGLGDANLPSRPHRSNSATRSSR